MGENTVVMMKGKDPKGVTYGRGGVPPIKLQDILDEAKKRGIKIEKVTPITSGRDRREKGKDEPVGGLWKGAGVEFDIFRNAKPLGEAITRKGETGESGTVSGKGEAGKSKAARIVRGVAMWLATAAVVGIGLCSEPGDVYFSERGDAVREAAKAGAARVREAVSGDGEETKTQGALTEPAAREAKRVKEMIRQELRTGGDGKVSPGELGVKK